MDRTRVFAGRAERRLALRVLLPMAAAIGLLVVVCLLGMQILSGLRAYAAGESEWSKARAEAVAYLHAYLLHGDRDSYASFLFALKVPEGDRLARLELEKPSPSLELARAGFLQGGNAPEDGDLLIWTFRLLHHAPPAQDALLAWREGDRLIAQLRKLGERVDALRQGAAGPDNVSTLHHEIERLGSELLIAERRFSSTLGRASRITTNVLVASVLLIGLLLALAATWLVRRTLLLHLADQRALSEMNQRFAMAAQADGLGVFVWQVAEDRLELDARGIELYGGPPGWRPGRAELREHHHPDDRMRAEAEFDQSLRDGTPVSTRLRVRQLGGGWHHIEVNGRMYDHGDPQRARMVGIVRDITQELAQAQLRADKELAERTAAARMAFLSRLSHELRTPLNAILGLAHLLMVDARDRLSANQARRVKLLMESGRNLLRLVEDVLDITHIDAGRLQLVTERVDLVEVVRSCVPLVEDHRALLDVRIEPDLPAEPVWVDGDRQRLQQVFVNLLSNACKYNRRGGRVSLRWQRGPEVTVAVCDEGRGLSEAERAELFQAFRRFDPPPEVPGSGIGLVVVRMLVEQMQGRIEVESRVGEGSCFSVHLPAATMGG